jgi:iron complex transport system ATP-binding protein
MNKAIQVKDLTFGYGRNGVILDGISFEISRGQFIGVVGPNGAGKSTLINLLCRKLAPKAGTIVIDSAPIESYSVEALARKVAVVRQEFVPVFGFSVIETVMMARTPYFSRIGFENKGDREMVVEALRATDTFGFASRTLESLSGGERQLVFIARALAQDTNILLLDEPTNFLDLKHQVEIYDLLKSWQLERSKTIVAVTHDINLAAQYCDKALILGSGGGCEYGSSEEIICPERIRRVFGVNGFVGRVGREKFFIPLGKFAKDGREIDGRRHDARQQK